MKKTYPQFRWLAVSLFLMTAAYAQQVDHSAEFDSAKVFYRQANFERAIYLLDEIGYDQSAGSAVRREALWLLAKCHVARNASASARKTVDTLLTLEPPTFAPDFEREPLPLLRIYYAARKEKSGNAEVERPDPGVQILAVVAFKNHSFVKNSQQYNPLEKGIAEIIGYSLLGATRLKIVERERVQWLIDEQKLQNTHNMDGAVRVGKLLGVHVVLLGSFILQENKELILNARLVKVESGEVLLHEKVEGKFKNFDTMTEDLAKAITEAVGEKEIYVARAEVPKTLDAMMAYSEGLVYLDKEMYEAAHAKFELALKNDAGFERARKAMERIQLPQFAERDDR